MLNKIKSLIKNKKAIGAVILFLLVFAALTYTSAKTHVSIADSDEYSTIGYILGVAHAPGYPLYIAIIYLFTHLIPFGSIAFRANLTSVFFDSLTAVFVYFINLEILSNVKLKGIDERVKKKKYKTFFYYYEDPYLVSSKIVFSFISSLFLVFSFLFWFYSNVAEVFALNNFFVVVLIYLLLLITKKAFKSRYAPLESLLHKDDEDYSYDKLKDESKSITKLLILLCIVAALALSHLQTILLIYPVLFLYLVFILYRGKYLKLVFSPKRIALFIIVFIVTFFIPFIMMLYFSSLGTSVSWKINPGISGLIEYMTRQNYNIVNAGGSTQAGSAYVHQVDAGVAFASISPYFTSVYNDFTIFPLIFAFIGFIYLLIKNRWLSFLLGSTYIVSGILFAMYDVYPNANGNIDMLTKNWGNIAILQRQYIMGDVILSLFCAAGMYWILKLSLNGFAKLRTEDVLAKDKLYEKVQSIIPTGDYSIKGILLATIIISLVSLGVVANEFVANYKSADLNSYTYIDTYAKEALNNVPKDSMIVCFSDTSCFSLMYAQVVEGIRPDVTLYTFTYDIRQHYLDSIKSLDRFHYNYGPEYVGDAISWNIVNNHKHVFITDVTTDYLTFLGLDSGAYFLAPHGVLQEIENKVPSGKDVYDFTAAKAYASYFKTHSSGVDDKNMWYKYMVGYFDREIVVDAYLYWEEGNTKEALREVNLSYSLNDGLPESVSLNQKISEYLNDKSKFYPGEHIPSASVYLDAAIKDEYSNPSMAVNYARYASYIDPLNLEAHLFLAFMYDKSAGDETRAKKEYENVLSIDPKNTQAAKSLEALNSSSSN